jgi:hypothetical protein
MMDGETHKGLLAQESNFLSMNKKGFYSRREKRIGKGDVQERDLNDGRDS